MEVTGDVLREWHSGKLGAGLGVGVSIFGFDTGPRWMGVLGGPFASGSLRVLGPVSLGLALRADVGRVPVVTAWGLPLNFMGVFPIAVATVGWEPSQRVRLTLSGGPRWVNTWSWSGAGVDAGLAGALLW